MHVSATDFTDPRTTTTSNNDDNVDDDDAAMARRSISSIRLTSKRRSDKGTHIIQSVIYIVIVCPCRRLSTRFLPRERYSRALHGFARPRSTNNGAFAQAGRHPTVFMQCRRYTRTLPCVRL